ncbi:MAG: hypothetical protein IKE91_00780 [Clostridia bacterium]|nr:hypothetical protein [Clostridia bacterium]
MKNKYEHLSVDEAMLSKEQLELYMKKIASAHTLKLKSDRRTYPVPRVKENLKFILEVYNILNEDIKNNIPIHPAGEWLLDNYYIIEKNTKIIIKDLNIKKYKNLIGIANGKHSGYARAFCIANEIVSYTDGKIDGEDVELFLAAYQSKKTLSMEELWSITIFLQINLIEKIREICEKIYLSQMQKRKVESIVTRLVELKEERIINNNIRNKVDDSSVSKYPFIEYMSFKLKRYGRKSYSYIQILEEQLNRMGSTIEECIRREHYDIAAKKISIGNSISSMNNLNRLNFVEIFDRINGVEEVLKKDPANVYENMDYETKEYYRNTIEKISKKIKISELFIAQKCVELCNNKESKEAHVGYYLIDDGRKKLFEILLNKRINNAEKTIKNNKNKQEKKKKSILVLSFINWIFSIIISGVLGYNLNIKTNNFSVSVIAYFLLIFIIKNIFGKISQFISGKIIKPKIIPKLDFTNGVPEKYSTMVVIPTIIDSREKVRAAFKKLEVYYHANKSDNIYFSLLGDCTCEKEERVNHDNEVVDECYKMINELNEKYYDNKYKKFNFIYRKRAWCKCEKSYIGWERKRGLLTEFNEYILGKNNNIFYSNSFEINDKKIPQIKYIITLDFDTNLTLNSGIELIGAMAHILNKPEVDEEKNIIKRGYGIIQPRVGIGINEANKSIFSKLFAGNSGTDSYTNAVSDFYQDNYGEGIYTGKGIYDVEVFSRILKNEIPQNKVLSHDLLEGCYLRCGLASDIVLMDGFPSTYDAYRSRLHRWIRGDYQIVEWLLNKKISILSKFKMIDNMLRSLLDFIALILIFIGYFINSKLLFFIPIIAINFSYLLDIIDKLIIRKNGQSKQKKYYKELSGVSAKIIKILFEIALIPDKAYLGINAAVKSLYRLIISKEHLLEWTTSEENEKITKNSMIFYYKKMIFNFIAGIFSIGLGFIFNNIFAIIIGFIWIIIPAIMYKISKQICRINLYEKLNKNDKNYVVGIAQKTWNYFKDYLTKNNNYLPPDNYQENRKDKIVLRTSPTNIGLALLSVVSSYDLGFENKDDTINLIDKMLITIDKLPKWNGHLYNWYDITNLQPLYPKYVSSVDSGNFVGYLFVLRQFLIKENNSNEIISNDIKIINKIINSTDFSKLFNQKNGLFSIGFNCEENKITDSYYDLLASEARQTSVVAIAKKDVSAKHWKNLSRSLTTLNKYKGLVSWTGTAFEYLMPAINIKRYPGSLLDESCKFMIMSQIEYAKKLGTTWGFSEAAFNLKDFNGNYQYKAFGIPWLGLKRGLADEVVVSSYGTILAINDTPQKVVDNLKQLEKIGMNNKYGFYESVDYTPGRAKKDKNYSIVKTYMAHHQGLILLSINNLINNNILQDRFFYNPEIESVDILLQEKMPENVILTKEKKEHIEKIKYADFNYYSERVFEKNKKRTFSGEKYNLISNNDYTILIDSNGNGYSKYKDIFINRYKKTDEIPGGIMLYIKDEKNNIWNLYNNQNNKIIFYPDSAEFIGENDSIKTKTSLLISTENHVEIRRINIKNTKNNKIKFEFYSIFEPVLSEIKQDYAHKAFNKLFITFEFFENILIVKRKARLENENDYYLAITLFSDKNNCNDFEFDINKLNVFGRNCYDIPDVVKESKKLKNNVNNNTNQAIALKKIIELNNDDEIDINLIMSISNNKNDAIDSVKKYTNIDSINRSIKLSKAQTEANIQYMEMTGKDVNLFERILSQMLNNCGKDYSKNDKNLNLSKSILWKYGISGERQIILIKIDEITEIDILKKLIKCYEYLKHLNNKFDLIILNNEEQSYENYLQDMINELLWNYTEDISNGIYILKNISFEDRKILEYRADLFIPGKCGRIDYLLDDLEENNKNKIKMYNQFSNNNCNKNISKYSSNQKYNEENLELYNGYGGFLDKEYIININKNKTTPVSWSNIIANENFGTVVTENMGGYTWYKNSRLNRITAWNNDSVSDYQSELIYFTDLENDYSWNASLGPIKDEGEFYIIYGLGYAKYIHQTNDIEQSVCVFVPKEDSIKINNIKLKNLLPNKRKIKVSYYLELVLGEDEIDSSNYIFVENNKYNNYILLKNLACDFDYWMFISSSEKMINFDKNKNIIKLDLEVDIAAYEEKNISIFFGCDDNEDNCKRVIKKYQNTDNSESEFNKTTRYWNNLTEKVLIKTPVKSINYLCNGWIIYQAYCSRILARSGYYQSGGAYGFRDQLQDSMCMKYFDLSIEKNQILKHCSHQFIEGDVLHWWHDETRRGVRTKFSDDLLWLPYVVYDYIEYSGDYSILEIDIPYLRGEILEKNIDEKYDYYELSDTRESVYWHCIRAIDKSLNFGRNGIPKIGSGDWNDGFNLIGNKGEGESVWLGFFLYNILNKFIKICEYKNDYNHQNNYKKISIKLKNNLNKNCWDGRWYNRAFCDNGRVIGSIKNQECKIDGISQSWSIISGCADDDKKEIAMNNLVNYLVDKNEGIIKLLNPPFEKEDITPGYIKSYLPGIRENGGQYTHGSIWAVIAETMLGNNNLAFDHFKMINPVEHSINKENADKYKIEPYVIAADIYSNIDMYGQGGWSWYTGSASWYFICLFKHILGIRIENNKLRFEPHIPNYWNEYSISFKYGESVYNIYFKNSNENNTNNCDVKIDGIAVENGNIELNNDGKIYTVDVTI